MAHFERVKPVPVFGELAQDRELIFSNGNARNKDRRVSEQVVISRAESYRDLQLHQCLHPFVDVDQLWNDAFGVKHVQKISRNADQVVAIGHPQNPVKPRFVEMKIGREEEFHLGFG